MFEVGEIVGGSYRIIRPLGEGGMGAVYEVEHLQLGVHYALKTFTLQDGETEILRKKFLTEGKVLARLNDPRLIRVFDLDIDESTGAPYYVMDLVLYKDGEPHTLADVDTSDLAESYILDWFRELAAALDYIHAQGIVHRDIKLNNVLLTEKKHIILSDFGISRLFKDGIRRDVNAVQTMVSQADGYIDATGNLTPAHDAATAHLGAPWRMPTDADFAALIKNCDTEWTTRNGRVGRLVKGKGVYAGKSIFLPAAGSSDSTGGSLGGTNSAGLYWSSSPNLLNSNHAFYLFLHTGNIQLNYNNRFFGRSVRPVRGPAH